MMNKIKFVKVIFAFLVLASASVANAVTINFGCITGSIAGDCAIGEVQLSVEMTAAGSNQVLFTFMNIGSEASSIADVYFEDGTLLGIASLDNSDPGVAFSQGATPGDLPGKNNASPPFVATSGFTADSDAPVQPNGVNPGEELGVLFNLKTGQTFADAVAALGIDPALEGSLRIGIHVQGFATGGSESFVSNVPVPAAVWLFGSGLLGLVGVARRKSHV